ncbi:MAG TPA: sugar transferase [Sphingopyxis sp.]|uniref:sugar transferase n=1 Tax=Sphingopyxis sp. TaxID=1908224 RepID=UPI002C2CE4F6|nr:sugar transferase [Sphingopyxis sp.]HWW55902.1 sugar transferase [Sphingopyxis sp.]
MPLSIAARRISMKRLFDVLLGLTLIPIAVIACLAAAIPIAIEAKASPLFFQTRLGVRERPFRLLKLRTMHVATPSLASHEVGASSILVTGRLLRRLKIDELPQIWNVLNGTMSFVGPRPGLPNQVELTEARRKQGVFDLVPGITGVAQIRGIDMSTPEKLALADKSYGQPWSLVQDLRILWATATGAGSGDAASGLGRR